jgi:hypothetical protein
MIAAASPHRTAQRSSNLGAKLRMPARAVLYVEDEAVLRELAAMKTSVLK